ncbi:hypothetical protein AGABI1DRAFT_107630 [Agaricus bisporus var. burnettii JB137-S8]|uniref:Uncharacterized protein n=1 Tax=Agaricus bisporus var. burnettii (strain JB137-S8 / ATCC MYA-4627 / FGSC 10392) TaxID=597362 RepID=K5XTT0_AGABU|nr:uncharacterized protein AGABI1DRAFT_107630 [Agaricus bisporus var. burnettii JB137-S8]EKM78460.1 hypothetical protein AGABI1DRAFT_107630 [Agaricus bisporus var. burnettii JB137-S8]
MFNFLRLVLLSINAFILKVLSFLRFNRPRNSTPAVDIELGGTSAVVATPGQHGLDVTRSATTPESSPSPTRTLVETSNRCSVLIIESSEPTAPGSEHSDSHASTESTRVESTEERSLESAATSVAPSLADRIEESKSSAAKDEEFLNSSQEGPSDDSSHTLNLALSAASSVVESRNMTMPRFSTQVITHPAYSMTFSYDGNSFDDDDDQGVPSHRCLKFAIDDVWCPKALHTIKEVDEENIEEEVYVDTSGVSPTIVVQSPSFGNSLSRAQSATNRLAAILKLLEGELSDSRNSMYMDSLDSNSKPEIDVRTSSSSGFDVGYDWYSKATDNYYIQPLKMCGAEGSCGLLPDDPFQKSL